MKRLILWAVAALVALPAAAQTQEAFPSYVQVYGRAEKEITPDEFYLQIIINERDSKGKISVESQQRDMIAALKRLNVDIDKQLKVANLSSEFFKKKSSVATAKYQLQLGSSADVIRGQFGGYEYPDAVEQSDIFHGQLPATLKATAQFLRGQGELDEVNDDYADALYIDAIDAVASSGNE